jgi:hypothetical protein
MGYSTWYNLDIDPVPAGDHPIWDEQIDYAEFREMWEQQGSDCGFESKWYEHAIELIMLSRKYPEFLFTLSGDGEENGDLWKKFFKGGKYYSEWQPDWTPPVFEDIKDKMMEWNHRTGIAWVSNDKVVCEKCLVELVLETSGQQRYEAGEVYDTYRDTLLCPKCGTEYEGRYYQPPKKGEEIG